MLAMAAVQSVRMMPRVPPRSGDLSPNLADIGRAFDVLMRRQGLNQTRLAERLGEKPQTISRWLLGQRGVLMRSDVQDRMLRAIGADREELVQELIKIRGAPPPKLPNDGRMVWAGGGGAMPVANDQLVPVRERIQPGAWMEPHDFAHDIDRSYPTLRDPRYPHADQWLAEVGGDGANLLCLNNGDLVHCVDAEAIGYYAKTGDVVVVERLRFEGTERELSLKQVESTAEGVRLWPRSSNPRFQEPLALEDVAGVKVRIRALVLVAIRRF